MEKIRKQKVKKEDEVIPRNYKNPVSLLAPVENRTPYWGRVVEHGITPATAKSKKRKRTKDASQSNPFLAPSVVSKDNTNILPNPHANRRNQVPEENYLASSTRSEPSGLRIHEGEETEKTKS